MLSPKGGKRAAMKSVMELLAALALFLLGLALLGRSLQHLAGGWMEAALRRWTGSRSRGLGLGLGMTALLQSSSAVTVMVASGSEKALLALLPKAAVPGFFSVPSAEAATALTTTVFSPV